jgi:hypothetical protein
MRGFKNLNEGQSPGVLFTRYTLNGFSKATINRHLFIHSKTKKIMKTNLLITTALVLSITVNAQQQPPDELVIRGSKPTTMEATPKQIIDSLHKRFPNAQSIDYYQTPAVAAKNGWAVSQEDDLEWGNEIEYYTLSFKRTDFQYYALFKADGTLVSSKYEETEANLPEAVTTAIKTLAATDYKDYKLYSKKYFKQVNQGKLKEYYEITGISKTDNTSKKMITMDPTGKVLKVN